MAMRTKWWKKCVYLKRLLGLRKDIPPLAGRLKVDVSAVVSPPGQLSFRCRGLTQQGFCTALCSVQDLPTVGPGTTGVEPSLESCHFLGESGSTQLSPEKVDQLGLCEERCPKGHS